MQERRIFCEQLVSLTVVINKRKAVAMMMILLMTIPEAARIISSGCNHSGLMRRKNSSN
jgi:hypothetical protein